MSDTPFLPDESDAFRSAIAGLWAHIGLGAPRFVEPGRIQLRIGDATLDLVDDSRGWLAIEAAILTLSSDQQILARQMRRILETNIGFLLDHEAGVHVRQLPGGKLVLAVWSSCSYRGLLTSRLAHKIEDVVHVLEYYAGQLVEKTARPDHRQASPGRAEDLEMIFRP